MVSKDYSDDQLSEMTEDAFVNIKEACKRLQERSKCSNQVVVDILTDVAEFYRIQDQKNNYLG